ncbi:putative cAMP-binding protein [Magnetospirillum sp. XM-1]|uniref:Crp/Fnr family transcriptional regulator n=1 Tax=Magnetospirillum sp. XM-1 TaxID=1663591 RepID=UPI00073DFDDB|nr:Crp/Fnr family transcriptional regulator [Magnetospirillum sp. XM-1]CUW37540.1 putative cAMP-binding protein [Magnetospirillum sp. XM-1]
MGLLKNFKENNVCLMRQPASPQMILLESCHLQHLFSSMTLASRGSRLFHEGDQITGVFKLVGGLVALERVDEDGNLIILKILRPGALFPCSGLLCDGLHNLAARAITDISTQFIPMDRIVEAIRNDPSIGLGLIKLSATEIQENENAIFRMCTVGLSERVLDILTILAEELGDRDSDGDLHLTLPMAWSDVAAMVGSGPEVMSRILRVLAKGGRLSFKRRHIIIYQTPRHSGAENANAAAIT